MLELFLIIDCFEGFYYFIQVKKKKKVYKRVSQKIRSYLKFYSCIKFVTFLSWVGIDPESWLPSRNLFLLLNFWKDKGKKKKKNS